MKGFKDYIAGLMIGRHVHVMCDCFFPLDVKGTITGYGISANEIIYYINDGKRTIKIGENTPNLKIEDENTL